MPKGGKEIETRYSKLKVSFNGDASIQKDLVQDEEPGHMTSSIPPVICSTRPPTRRYRGESNQSKLESPSQPPRIVSPSSLRFIKREGDMFETLRRGKLVSVLRESTSAGRAIGDINNVRRQIFTWTTLVTAGSAGVSPVFWEMRNV